MKKEAIAKAYDECHLLNELEKTKWALETARSNFENVVDPDLIDCYIYELQAVQMRYKFLLEKAKQSNISAKGYQMVPYAKKEML
ncbi:MAG: YaaL family protein [Lachnospiraceae bacterium]|nr:YaaL family protein [Lachnospiraceae bacterium]